MTPNEIADALEQYVPDLNGNRRIPDDMWQQIVAHLRAPAALPELPSLPTPKKAWLASSLEYFTADQMRQYALAALAGRGQDVAWVSVEERMPSDGEPVLVYIPGSAYKITIDTWRMQHEAPVEWSSATVEIGMMWDDFAFEQVTHWMPLPKAPAAIAASAGNEKA